MVPYYITQPSTDNDVQIFSIATMVKLACSLNINIPSGVIITWFHNGSVIFTTKVFQNNSTMLQYAKTRPSDAGVYQCVFNDTTTGYILRRNIAVLSMYV